MTIDLVLASWPSMEDYLFMILIWRRDIPSINKKFIFVKGDVYALIGNPDHPDGSSTDHKYFCIRDDLFDRILETNQDSNITLKVIHKETSLLSINVKRSSSRS